MTMPVPVKMFHQLTMAARKIVLRKILRPNSGSSKNKCFDQCEVYCSTRVGSGTVNSALPYCSREEYLRTQIKSNPVMQFMSSILTGFIVHTVILSETFWIAPSPVRFCLMDKV